MSDKPLLGLPPQSAPTEASFDTRPAAVRRWVDALPVSDRGETTRRIFAALKEVNRLQLPLKQRMGFLESLAQPLSTMLKSLRWYFATGEYPLDSKAQKVARLVTRLQAELIIGYRIVLAGQSSSSWLFRKTHKAMWIVAVHRLFCCFAEILENFRQLNMPIPHGVWQEIHRLYYVIDELGWGDEQVERYGNFDQTSTLAGEYRRILLLSLIQFNRLRQSQIEEVQVIMTYWATAARLIKPDEGWEGRLAFCVRQDMDIPPTVNHGCCQREVEGRRLDLVLDTASIIREIEGLLAASDDDNVKLANGAPISRTTLEVLAGCWRPVQGKRLERAFSNEQVRLLVGFNATCNLLGHKAVIDEAHSEESEIEGLMLQPKADLQSEALLSGMRNEVASSREEAGDIWHQIYSGDERNRPKHWRELGVKQKFSEIAAQMINYSDHGYCFQLPGDDVRKLKIGELIAVQRDGQSRWELAALRWIQNGGSNSLLLGVENFATHPLAVSLQVKTERGRSEPINAIIAVGRDTELVLLLPYLHAVHKKQLTLAFEGYVTSLKLQDRQLITPVFEVFHFKDTHSAGEVPGAIEALKLLQLQEQEAHIFDEEFTSLWGELNAQRL